MKTKSILCAAVALALPAVASAQNLTRIGTYASGTFDGSAAEISAYDPVSQRLFVVNADADAVDVLDLSDPTNPTKVQSLTLDGSPNSVAVKSGVLAVAVQNATTTSPGLVQFFNTAGGAPLGQATVGALPDMLTFSPDGTKVLVANEGEPEGYLPGQVDPEGSVSVIGVTLGSGTVVVNDVRTAGFSGFNAQAAALRAQGVRVFGPNASVAQDLEPEYVGVSADSTTAIVTLQEANAVAVVDLATATVTSIKSLGFKDHSAAGNGLDASDRDDAINIATAPVKGMYMPDAIAPFTANGQAYFLTANEGDAREYDGFEEETRVKDLTLDPTAFPNAAALQADEAIGRLNVTSTLGDTDGDGDYDELYAFGGRSFSVLDGAGNLVFDSGDLLEQLTADALAANFNASNDDNEFDDRSDNKGPEPEGAVVGEAFGLTLGFIGLERVGGVVMLDLTDPTNPLVLDYINSRDFAQDPESPLAGDLGPEGLTFIAASDSPTGQPLLVLTNEVSGTTSVYSIAIPLPAAAWPGLAMLGGLVAARLRKRMKR